MGSEHDDAEDWGPPKDLGQGLLGMLKMNSEMQVYAIHQLLKAQESAESARQATIASLDEGARTAKTRAANESFEHDWLWELEISAYEDGAFSMALVAMLAPLVETLFHRVFLYFGERHREDPWTLPNHPRWNEDAALQWNCKHHGTLAKDQVNVVEGILELGKATGLDQFFTRPLERQQLEALFQYRNKMLHNGLEWPAEELQKFSKNVKRWPAEWFACATTAGEPSAYYVSPIFVRLWLKSIDDIVEALGKYTKARPC